MFQTYSFRQLEALIAERYRGRRCTVRAFGYPISLGDIAVSTTVETFQKTNNNVDFLMTGIYASDTAKLVLNRCLLQIVDTGSNRRLFDDPVPVNAVATGPAGFTRSLPYPWLIPGNSNLQITLQNLHDEQAYAGVEIYLEGVSVYVYG